MFILRFQSIFEAASPSFAREDCSTEKSRTKLSLAVSSCLTLKNFKLAFVVSNIPGSGINEDGTQLARREMQKDKTER